MNPVCVSAKLLSLIEPIAYLSNLTAGLNAPHNAMCEGNRVDLEPPDCRVAGRIDCRRGMVGAAGVSSGLRSYYVKSGWLEQPIRGVYRRPRGPLSWEQVVISLQTILGEKPLAVGGRTALALEGFEHYLSADVAAVHLYGPESPPSWLHKLKLPQRFVFHNSRRLFKAQVTGAEGIVRGIGTGTTNGLREPA